MAVRKDRRTLSGIQFIDTADKIFVELAHLSARKWGIKDKEYDAYDIASIWRIPDWLGGTSLTKEEYDQLKARHDAILAELEKLGICLRMSSFDRDLLALWTERMNDLSWNLRDVLDDANLIRLDSARNCERRRDLWESAIAICQKIERRLLSIHRVLGKKVRGVGRYRVIAELIDEEIRLLKGVAESDRVRFAGLPKMPADNS